MCYCGFFFFFLCILVEKQLYKNQSGGSAVISPRCCLFSQRGVAAVWSAHGCRGDECVLAFAGISAGRGSLHSDVKGSTQRQAVFFPWWTMKSASGLLNPERLFGPGLMWDQLERCQTVACCRSTHRALRVWVIGGSQGDFGHFSADRSCKVTVEVFCCWCCVHCTRSEAANKSIDLSVLYAL